MIVLRNKEFSNNLNSLCPDEINLGGLFLKKKKTFLGLGSKNKVIYLVTRKKDGHKFSDIELDVTKNCLSVTLPDLYVDKDFEEILKFLDTLLEFGPIEISGYEQGAYATMYDKLYKKYNYKPEERHVGYPLDMTFLIWVKKNSLSQPSSKTKKRSNPFLMEIDDVFCITGKGTIVTGKIKKGYVEVGDEVSLKGKDISEAAVVTGIEKFRRILDRASTGENVGINLRGIDHKKVHRGDILCSID